jgi:hypothetical protein
MRETWYVLENGLNADPREVVSDDKGVLRHQNGVAVAIGDHGNPRSRSVDVEEERKSKKPKTVEREAPSSRDRQIKSDEDSGPRYRTRDSHNRRDNDHG